MQNPSKTHPKFECMPVPTSHKTRPKICPKIYLKSKNTPAPTRRNPSGTFGIELNLGPTLAPRMHSPNLPDHTSATLASNGTFGSQFLTAEPCSQLLVPTNNRILQPGHSWDNRPTLQRYNNLIFSPNTALCDIHRLRSYIELSLYTESEGLWRRGVMYMSFQFIITSESQVAVNVWTCKGPFPAMGFPIWSWSHATWQQIKLCRRLKGRLFYRLSLLGYNSTDNILDW
ncbi:hypothetical protein BU17DRAFT_67489 [Hysterangium stoloniferum]|nr:hypothetical protein BU17DRAFT_67489 [Hysterangium stoloniferum]